MHLTQIKARIADYLHHLTNYDYIAYGWLFGVLIGFLLLAIALVGRSPKIALLMILLVLLLMVPGPFLMKFGLDKTVRKIELTDLNTTYLSYAKNLIVLGTIQNRGRVNMEGCRVFVDVVRQDSNRYKQFLYRFKPLRKEILKIEKKLPKGGKMPYKIVFDNFHLKKKYKIIQSVECF